MTNIFFDLLKVNKITTTFSTCSKSESNHLRSSHLRSSYLRNSHLRSSHLRSSFCQSKQNQIFDLFKVCKITTGLLICSKSIKQDYCDLKQNCLLLKTKLLWVKTPRYSVSDSNWDFSSDSDSDSSSVFMSLVIFVFFILYLHSPK